MGTPLRLVKGDEKSPTPTIKLELGKLLTSCARRMRPLKDLSEDLGAKHITPHQRVFLGLLLRQRLKRFSLAEASCFYYATVVSLLNRGLVALQSPDGVEVFLVITDTGQVASHQSPPVEVVMHEIKRGR